MMINYAGPLPASRALDSLADDIGDPIIERIMALPLTSEEKELLRRVIEEVLTGVFTGEKVFAIRDFMYRLYRENQSITSA